MPRRRRGSSSSLDKITPSPPPSWGVNKAGTSRPQPAGPSGAPSTPAGSGSVPRTPSSKRKARNALRTPTYLSKTFGNREDVETKDEDERCVRCAKEHLECYVQKAGAGFKRACYSCASLDCSFAKPPPAPSAPSTPLVEVIGRLEVLHRLEPDVNKKVEMKWCIDRLRGETGVNSV